MHLRKNAKYLQSKFTLTTILFYIIISIQPSSN